jgi:hypothetical protein
LDRSARSCTYPLIVTLGGTAYIAIDTPDMMLGTLRSKGRGKTK